MATVPNILFIMNDDHAAHAMSCYGSRINKTPHLDRIASEGARLDNCFCTNAICAPSRASILTGTYSHVNGVRRLHEPFDTRQTTVDGVLRERGYQSAIVGKWHLGHGREHDPAGFDYWCILPDQGEYHDPEMIELGERKKFAGYVTDIITDLSLNWLDRHDRSRPFFLSVHHKAPHRPWQPDDKHADLYSDIDVPEPATIDDTYANRASAARAARMRILDDITDSDTKGPPPEGLAGKALQRWKYQRYIKDYLRCIASVDDNVGRILKYLDEQGLAENTLVIYTSDQGFFLGDHGWYDKRFFYEESLRMPFLARYPKEIPAGTVGGNMVLNVDFAPLLLDYASTDIPSSMQGRSFRRILRDDAPDDWRTTMYYRYYDYPGDCDIYAHFGVRTSRYKLIYYYDPGPAEWELFDLERDPHEMVNVYHDPEYRDVAQNLRGELERLRLELKDYDEPWPSA